jgi:hypothetical protein
MALLDLIDASRRRRNAIGRRRRPAIRDRLQPALTRH